MIGRPKVLLLIPHLRGGGAERVFELLARNLPASKYELHLGLPTTGDTAGLDLPPWLAVHGLHELRVRSSALPLLRLVRRLQPAVILSTMAHLNFLVLALRPLFPRSTRVLVRQNGTASAMLGDLRMPVFTRMLYRSLYNRADAVLCQSSAMAEDLRRAGVMRSRLVVAPNPVIIPIRAATALSASDATGSSLLAVGRLVPQKGYDLLLEALQRLRASHPSVRLSIAGAGVCEGALRRQCTALGLEESVRFAGHVPSPEALYSGATLFVSSSRQEGMPNALLEAAAAGLPIVSTPSSGGVVELLRGRAGVWLTEEVSATALAMQLKEALARLEPGQRFEHAWIAPYRLENAIAAYEEMIDRALASAREVVA